MQLTFAILVVKMKQVFKKVLIIFVAVVLVHVVVNPALYRVFHRFGQAKFPDGGSVLDSILPQLPPKILLNSKVVKINPKIIISLF